MGHASRERAAGDILREALRQREREAGHVTRGPSPCRVCWGRGYIWRRRWVDWLGAHEWSTSTRAGCEACDATGVEPAAILTQVTDGGGT